MLAAPLHYNPHNLALYFTLLCLCVLPLHQVQQGQDATPAQSSSDKQPNSSTTTTTSGRSGSFLSRWRRSSAGANSSSHATCAAAPANTSSTGSSSQPVSSGDVAGPGSSQFDGPSPAVVAETTTFELVEAQGPLMESLMQEPFVLVRPMCMMWSPVAFSCAPLPFHPAAFNSGCD